MATWKTKFETDIKLDGAFVALKSLFTDGTIKKMSSLLDYSPTKIASLLRMNYNSFLIKVHQPWKFSTEHILLLSFIIDIDPTYIFNVIQSESHKHLKTLSNNYIDKLKKESIKG
ncbi:hypothetical protein [Sphingobacterium siyangense]|jgi:hypothetical protein|uniref:XRE family transcriptional regulator n=2 Tax=Sphingobacterium TaxID=28453 RepID=A0ABX7CSL9_SPHMU|nr:MULTISPECIES: hypothetical protein [Sphingobacterium]QQT53167.1 hypothetical protein I6I98_23465 [Sphingobacterium multivorum]